MEIIIASNPLTESLKRFRRRRGYNRFVGTSPNRRNMKTVQMGSAQRGWRIKYVPKIKLKMVLSTPFRVWRKLKNAYVSMMLNLGGNGNVFGDRRVPKGRQVRMSYSPTDFDNRLVLEIYKSLVTSRELATTN